MIPGSIGPAPTKELSQRGDYQVGWWGTGGDLSAGNWTTESGEEIQILRGRLRDGRRFVIDEWHVPRKCLPIEFHHLRRRVRAAERWCRRRAETVESAPSI